MESESGTVRVHDPHAGEQSVRPGTRTGNSCVCPKCAQGRVAVCFATLLARSTGHAEPNLDYSSPLQAYAAAQGQLAYYQALSESGEVRLIKNLTELNNHILEWEQWESNTQKTQPPLGLIISMESADPILKPRSTTGVERSGRTDHRSRPLWSGSLCRRDFH